MSMETGATTAARRLATGIVGVSTLLFLGGGIAHAGYITTPNITPVYSQVSFGDTPITINWLAPAPQIVNGALAVIDSEAEWAALVALAPDASPIVDVFFLTAINWCGIAEPDIVGCAPQPGHVLTVDSDFVGTDALGGVAVAHELGHDLDLGHVGDENATGNLMNPRLNSSVLDIPQANLVLLSALVQIDPTDGHRFINLRPIAVVPGAATWILSLAGVGAIVLRLRRSGRRVGLPSSHGTC